MEEAFKTLVGISGLFASISIAETHAVVGLLLAIASLVYMIVSIVEKIKKWNDGQ